MADQIEETLEAEVEQTSVDPWAAAFAALDPKDEEPAETAANAGQAEPGSEELPDTEGADEGEGAAAPEAGDGSEPEDVPGGPGDLGGADGSEDVRFDWDGIDISESSIESFRNSIMEDIRERTITDVAREYVRQGARNNNGRLGASINDPDVCKRDRDGVPRFYNPETGREFTGDNPRRQAQEWVDDYNRELSEAFNKTCQDYSQKLLKQEGIKLAVVEFAPKYQALDPTRRSMFEAIIEDYEVTDNNGDVIGYSCDLDKALAAVNRQVAAIQRKYSHHQQTQAAPAKPAASGPVLDTPSTSNTAQQNGKPQFKSIEEAMEWEQDQILAKMKGNAR